MNIKYLIIKLVALITLISVAPFVSWGADDVAEAPAKKNLRDYPHGHDEEDIKVQTDLKRPSALIDEKSIQNRVLKNFLKKTGDEATTDSESGYKTQ